MDSLLSRYRYLTLLLVVIFAQLLLLAYQVRTEQDVRLIRVWAVTAVTPAARLLEYVRSGTTSLVNRYVALRGAREESIRLRAELDRLKLENQRLHMELATAERVRALEQFRAATPSRTLAARVIGASPGASARAVLVDRGSVDGVKRGMAVIVPDGIVGKVVAAYPTASQVQLLTDAAFAAGVVGQKGRARGLVKGRGERECEVQYVRDELPVEAGERFFTSGNDRIFPKGLPVGRVVRVESGNPFKIIRLVPSADLADLEEVLVVVEGIHQEVPDPSTASPEFSLLPPPPDSVPATPEATSSREAMSAGAAQLPASATPGSLITDADRVREKYRRINESRSQPFGTGYASAPAVVEPTPDAEPPRGAVPPDAGAAAGAPNQRTAPVAPPPPMSSAPKPPREGAP